MKKMSRYIKSRKSLLAIIAVVLFAFFGETPAQTETLVSPFQESETLGEYVLEFESLQLVEQADLKKIFAVEGRLISHIYRKPKTKSELEVFRSYENELKAAGFDIISASTDKIQNGYVVNQIYGKKNNDLLGRKYKISLKAKKPNAGAVQFFSEYYLAAKKNAADKNFYVAIAIGRENLYVVDVLEVANMETGTVKISEELLTKRIDNDGKFIIYSIYFDTGKAIILPESKETLETMASYLKNNSNSQFYIVGHTDDTGTFSNNMNLSERRASAVVNSLQTRYGISPNQVESKGVGPLAPVATNETDNGRKLNRRVELVLRLKF